MITAAEIRIGNYLNLGRYIAPVISISPTVIGLGKPINKEAEEIGRIGTIGAKIGEGYFFMIDPVPLNEEWLIKYGFQEKSKHEYIQWIRTVEGTSIHCELQEQEGDGGDGIGEYTFNFRLRIEYVHQLQNLYFALTKQELELNK